MSLIHDALRRGQSTGGGRSQRAAHADAVLAALGYRPDPKTAPRLKVFVGLLVGLAGVVYVIAAFNHDHKAPAAKMPIARATPRAPVAGNLAPAATHAAPIVTATPVHDTPPTPSVAEPRPPVDAAPERAAARATSIARITQTTSPVSSRPRPKAVPATASPAPMGVPDDFQLALYYQRSGDFEQSLVHYKAVIGRDELNVEAHNNLGRLYLDKGLIEEAIREFQRVTAIDPRYVRARINLAAAYFKQNHYDLSAAEARAALAIEPRNVDALVNLALAEKAAGQIDDARESLLSALRIDQHNAAAHYNLARQYEEVGESALALSHYEAFLKYAGPDQAAYAPDVRGRIVALSARIK